MLQIIADSGSTKTDWVLLRPGAVPRRFKSRGLNPSLMGGHQIREVLQADVQPLLKEFVRQFTEPDRTAHDLNRGNWCKGEIALEFFGSGCRPEQVARMSRLLRDVLEISQVHVASDLMGAARALCGQEEGVVCILGTGSGSALYDGAQFVRSTPSLGYILGDEGSGASLGKHLLSDMMKGLFPMEITNLFMRRYEIDIAQLIQRVYREPSPNVFLSQFTRFLSDHRDAASVHHLLLQEFRSFFVRNIRAYARPDLAVHFVGSIASVFEAELRESARSTGFKVGRVLRAPLDVVNSAEASWQCFLDN